MVDFLLLFYFRYFIGVFLHKKQPVIDFNIKFMLNISFLYFNIRKKMQD